MQKKVMRFDASKMLHTLNSSVYKFLKIKNNKILKPIFFAWLFGSGMAFAASGKITITSPADGAIVNSHDNIRLGYEAVPGPGGDHLHLNVDGKRMDVIRQLRGTTEINPLLPGKHQICLAVNTKAHVSTGVKRCISLTSR